ncbi:MAG: hypothetical protein HY917_05240, partial [Candidatus Diapherotrites archaeon]|nr:hypothetical protein [Candidatus Diapherotrites archaeon]
EIRVFREGEEPVLITPASVLVLPEKFKLGDIVFFEITDSAGYLVKTPARLGPEDFAGK